VALAFLAVSGQKDRARIDVLASNWVQRGSRMDARRKVDKGWIDYYEGVTNHAIQMVVRSATQSLSSHHGGRDSLPGAGARWRTGLFATEYTQSSLCRAGRSARKQVVMVENQLNQLATWPNTESPSPINSLGPSLDITTLRQIVNTGQRSLTL